MSWFLMSQLMSVLVLRAHCSSSDQQACLPIAIARACKS